MKGEAEKKNPAAAAPNEAVKENQVRVESSAAAAAGAAAVAAGAGAAAPAAAVPPAVAAPVPGGRARQPFTQLSQLESDMAIARALQEQERAYMLLRAGAGYNLDDDDSDEDAGEEPQAGAVIDGSNYDNDEAFARALQEAEYTTARMMAFAGIQDDGEDDEEEVEEAGEEEEDGEDGEDGNDFEDDDGEDGNEDEEEDNEDVGSDDESEDMWEDVDPDNMTYEELIALGEAVGTESKGLAVNLIDELPLSSYKRDQSESGSTSSDHEQCVICRHDYEEEETLLTLPCKHKYHSECIRQWLQINKVCPVCSAGVDGS